ncbi:MAG: LOG family protein [Pseudomonadota bacterium]
MTTVKAYTNTEFLKSRAARAIRILAEYEEPRQRLEAQGVENTVVVFGSARPLPGEVAKSRLSHAQRDLTLARTEGERAVAQEAIRVAEQRVRLSRYYDDARLLSRMLTEWSVDRDGGKKYVICSGGGPGIMEAANRGAADVEGGRSVGFGITLPFEERVNQYVPDELAFEFHYFFMRKYWFVYKASALVAFPGGFGTMDELMESMTLRQTGRLAKRMPLLLYGSEYWKRVLDIEAMAEWGTISQRDLDLVHYADTPKEACEYLIASLIAVEAGTWDPYAAPWSQRSP